MYNDMYRFFIFSLANLIVYIAGVKNGSAAQEHFVKQDCRTLTGNKPHD